MGRGLGAARGAAHSRDHLGAACCSCIAVVVWRSALGLPCCCALHATHFTLHLHCIALHTNADLWDWHRYTNPVDMFNRRTEFDGKTPQNSNYIFASGGWVV